VLPEHHIQHPVHRLDAPVAPDQCRQLPGRPGVAADVVVRRARVAPLHLALAPDVDHRRSVGPRPRQPFGAVDHRHVALLVPPVTATWPSVRRLAVAHALTRCRQPVAVSILDARTDLPSIATAKSPVAWHAAAIHRPNACANAPGSSLAKTRANVSALGTPLG